MSNFREMTPQRLQNGCSKNCKLLKYEHITDHIKASDLEIPLIYKMFRDICKFRENTSKNRFREIF